MNDCTCETTYFTLAMALECTEKTPARVTNMAESTE